MNNLATIENKMATVWETEESIREIKSIFAPKLTDLEFKCFVELGKTTGLNPFLKELWAVKYDGSGAAQIFIGRDGYRKSAQRSSYYDYHFADAVYSNDTFDVVNGEISHRYNLKDRGYLVGAYCTVQRKGSSRPTYVYVDVNEYNKKQSVWKEKPATMIKKVAEAQALKSAFQELFAGTYNEYEDFTPDITPASKPGKGIQGLKEKLGLVEPASEVVDAEFDKVTGELSGEDDYPFVTAEDVKDLIDKAINIEDLLKIRTLAKSLTEDEKKSLHVLYREKEKQLSF